MRSWSHYYWYRVLHTKVTVVVHRMSQLQPYHNTKTSMEFEVINNEPRWDPSRLDVRQKLIGDLESLKSDELKFRYLTGILHCSQFESVEGDCIDINVNIVAADFGCYNVDIDLNTSH